MNSRTFESSAGMSAGVLAVAVVGVLLGAGSAEAGSIFMKNGYIIQGPIVEHNDEAVVLGWENGKVTVHRRFVESVSYDPGEEEQLKKLQAERLERLKDHGREDLDYAERSDLDDLPADLDVFLRLYAQGQKDLLLATKEPAVDLDSSADDLLIDDDDSLDVGDAGEGTPTTGVDTVEDRPPASRVFSSGGEVSLIPPGGWEPEELNGVMVVKGPEDEETGTVPSLNIVEMPRNSSALSEQFELLKEAQLQTLANFDLLFEGPREMPQGREAYEIVGRGLMNRRMMVVRQVLVSQGDRVWLVSGFSGGAEDDDAYRLIDESLATLEFSGY